MDYLRSRTDIQRMRCELRCSLRRLGQKVDGESMCPAVAHMEGKTFTVYRGRM